MSAIEHDDGLVHGHAWASEKAKAPRPAAPRGARPERREEEIFDDGLVHTHGWACGERGRERHAR